MKTKLSDLLKFVFLLIMSIMLYECKSDELNIQGPDVPDVPEVSDIPLGTMDNSFRLFLLENFDLDGDGMISEAEAALVKEMDCSNKSIESIEGIGYFPNLEKLEISVTNIRSIDMSNNPELRELICSQNSLLESINVSNNPKLVSLICSQSIIAELDVSDCHALEILNCSYGRLSSLKTNPELKFLDIRGHRINALDFKENKVLKELYCGSSDLIALDVSNSVLDSLDCSQSSGLVAFNIDGCNMLKSLNCNLGYPYNSLSCPSLEKLSANRENLDISGCTGLKVLNFYGHFDRLDLSKNTELEDLRITTSEIGKIDLSNNMKLVNFVIDVFSRSGQVEFQDFDLSNHKSLKKIDFNWQDKWDYAGTFGSFNLSGCTSLETVFIYMVNLESLNVSGCSSLTSLFCRDIPLSALNTDGCTALKSVDCSGTQISVLDLSQSSGLLSLNCHRSGLTALDVKECTNLTFLDCSNNQLSELAIENCKNLSELNFSNNKITSMVIKSENISVLNCGDNLLTQTDFLNDLQLKELYCSGLSMNSLDLSGQTNLEKLDCSNNLLTKLDVSYCSKLTFVNCGSNQIQPALDISKCPVLEELVCWSNAGLIELIVTLNQLTDSKVKISKDSQTQIVITD